MATLPQVTKRRGQDGCEICTLEHSATDCPDFLKNNTAQGKKRHVQVKYESGGDSERAVTSSRLNYEDLEHRDFDHADARNRPVDEDTKFDDPVLTTTVGRGNYENLEGHPQNKSKYEVAIIEASCPKRLGRNTLGIEGFIRSNLFFSESSLPPYDSSTVPPHDELPEVKRGTLVVDEAQFRAFPMNNKLDFGVLRKDSTLAYFDRTHYIYIIECMPYDTLLFLRPHQFGKSLTLSMLAYFHGFEHGEDYSMLFKGLAIHKDVEEGKIIPNQYFILTFNFSGIEPAEDPEAAKSNLHKKINYGIKSFYRNYARYLESGTGDELIRKHIDLSDSVESLRTCVGIVVGKLKDVYLSRDKGHLLAGVKGIYLLTDDYDGSSNQYLDIDGGKRSNSSKMLLKSFWEQVKESMSNCGIKKSFITGIAPLAMADSDFNIAENVSNFRELSGLCGLTSDDVYSALRLHGMCNSERDVASNYDYMQSHFNGYRFSPYTDSERIFNTNASLEYLMYIKQKRPIFEQWDPPHSKVFEQLLELLAASPLAHNTLKDIALDLPSVLDHKTSILHNPIQCENLEKWSFFSFFDLVTEPKSRDGWLSLMRYHGGLTYADLEPEKNLQIPNITYRRFILNILKRYDPTVNDVRAALQDFVDTGNISPLLKNYQNLICQHDDFNMSEDKHRDMFYLYLILNPAWQEIIPEYKVVKSPGEKGRITFLIKSKSPNRRSLLVIIEIKVIKIDYLDIEPASGSSRLSRSQKASALSKIDMVEELLQLKFADDDELPIGNSSKVKRAGMTIDEWIMHSDGPTLQLKTYWECLNICNKQKTHTAVAVLIVIIGSRKILHCKMNSDGQLGKLQLAEEYEF